MEGGWGGWRKGEEAGGGGDQEIRWLCVLAPLLFLPFWWVYRELSNEKKGKNLERESDPKGNQIYGRMIFNPVSPKAALSLRS